MVNNEIDEKWLASKATITARECGQILTEEIARYVALAEQTMGKRMAGMIKELLVQFGSSVAGRIFNEHSLEIDDKEDTDGK